MNRLARILGWLGFAGKGKRPPAKREKAARKTAAPRPAARSAARSAARPGAAPKREEKPAPRTFPRGTALEDTRFAHAASHAEQELLDRIGRRIESGRFRLPQLPTTRTILIQMASRAGADVKEIVQLISTDPTLASELLRIANSVMYATHMPAETLDQALMRIGLRGLHSLVFSVSVKGSVLDLKQLEVYSEEVWRQAFSVGSIARRIAPRIGQTKERAFLIGLLHDVGKIALLSMLSQETEAADVIKPATVGRIFQLHHERVGALLAEKWHLSDELVSVAGCHHRFLENTEYGHSAALASLANKIDLHLLQGDEEGYAHLASCEEFVYLGVSEDRRHEVLRDARECFEELASPTAV